MKMEDFSYNFVVRVFILSHFRAVSCYYKRSCVLTNNTHFHAAACKKFKGYQQMFWTMVLHCYQKLFGLFFVFVWKEIAMYNCYTFLHSNYKLTSVKSVVFVINCRQRIGQYVKEIDKLFTIPLYLLRIFFFMSDLFPYED